MKTVAIIQARIQSTRLPAKVLREIGDQTMLERVVTRTRMADKIDEVVIATSNTPADEILLEHCRANDWNYVAGSEHDVLSRYVAATNQFEADRIVRITSDCPLIDPDIIDQVVDVSDRQDVDYACNFYPLRYFPRGLDCELITRETLMRVDRLATSARQREHVTLQIYEGGEDSYQIGSVIAPKDWSHLRWTVDTFEDLELVRSIYAAMDTSDFRWTDVLRAYEENPHWLTINHGTMQKVA